MKTMTAIVLIGMAAVAATPAFAGRDESQIMATRRAAEVRKAEDQAQAKQDGKGLAGAVGVPGKLGPGTRPVIMKRDPSTHP